MTAFAPGMGRTDKFEGDAVKGTRLAVSLGVCLFVSIGSASALTDEEIFRAFQFNFLNPGARTLGMGGAAVAGVTDGTAAQANPAGLRYVTRPEFFAEFRGISRDSEVFGSQLGSLDVDPLSGSRDLPFLGLTSVSNPASTSELNFVSFAWPLELGAAKRRLVLSASRQVVLTDERVLETSTQNTELRLAFDSFPNTVNGGQIEAYSISGPVRGQLDTDIIYWNLGASFDVHPDFSVGVTVSDASLDLRAATLTRIEDPLGLTVDPTHPRLGGQPTTDVFRSNINDSDSDVAFTVGVHWHPDSVFSSGPSAFRVGAVFRKGVSFDVTETMTLNDAPDGTLEVGVIVPDRYSVGASYQTKSRWNLAAELERIEYSDLLEGYQAGVNFLTSGRIVDSLAAIDPNGTVAYDVDDGNVVRVGAEYVLPLSRSGGQLSFRGGYFRTPDSRIRMTQFNSLDPMINDVYLDAFRGGTDEDHYTVGVGFEFKLASIEAAAEFSDSGWQVVESVVFRLGKK